MTPPTMEEFIEMSSHQLYLWASDDLEAAYEELGLPDLEDCQRILSKAHDAWLGREGAAERLYVQVLLLWFKANAHSRLNALADALIVRSGALANMVTVDYFQEMQGIEKRMRQGETGLLNVWQELTLAFAHHCDRFYSLERQDLGRCRDRLKRLTRDPRDANARLAAHLDKVLNSETYVL